MIMLSKVRNMKTMRVVTKLISEVEVEVEVGRERKKWKH